MAISDDHAGFTRAEQAYKTFVSDPARLNATRRHVAGVESAPDAAARADLLHGLRGWLAVFDANVIEGGEAAALMAQLVEAESALFAARQSLVLTHVNERGEREEATLMKLATNIATNPVEDRRRTSFDALRELERWVLEHGYLEIVALRNRFARALGYENYFDYKVRKQERLTPRQPFEDRKS